MGKRKYLISVLFIAILLIGWLIWSERTTVTVSMDERGDICVYVNHKQSTDRIKAVYKADEEIYYFFLPSYVHDQKINLDRDFITEEEIGVGDEQVHTIEREGHCYSVAFLHSANLPTIFLTPDSGSIEFINKAKENREGGEICIYNSGGEKEYLGKVDDIHGRGNSTWARTKKSYNISLHREAPLCGLESGKKWVLLSLVFEDSKLNNMVALDLARELGMEYTSQATWVDLYVSGEYCGIYLLVEQITCDRGRVELGKDQGAFLVEKEIPERFEVEDYKFLTTHQKQFVVQYPKNPSEKQIETITARMNLVEEQLYDGTPDFENLIDIDSFAAHFLVDEITNQIDSELTSMYFYQKTENGRIYAGPIWDYDYSLGASYPDFSQSILEHEPNDIEEYKPDYLHWYPLLCENEAFRERVQEILLSKQTYLGDLLKKRIPEWTETIRDSMHMDTVRWSGIEQGTRYGCFDQDVRYLSYYLEKRINSINSQWNISNVYDVIQCNDEVHRVQFMQNDEVINTYYAPDAGLLSVLPDKCMHSTWVFPGNSQSFCEYSPILGDISVNCLLDWNGTEACAVINRLKQQTEVEAYWNLLNENASKLSFCVWIPRESKLWEQIDKEATEELWIVDNGSGCTWTSENGEALSVSTTFGSVNYGVDGDEDCFLYIQNEETNYVDGAESPSDQTPDIIFVVVNRELGAIEDVHSFTLP